jgi:hypothetical protein
MILISLRMRKNMVSPPAGSAPALLPSSWFSQVAAGTTGLVQLWQVVGTGSSAFPGRLRGRTVRAVKPYPAQGWYRDPFHAHEDRYFSAGNPTKLVRDAGRESNDDPPDQLYAAADLVRVPEGEDDFSGRDLIRADAAERRGASADLRRADDASLDPPYSSDVAKRKVFDQFDRMQPN